MVKWTDERGAYLRANYATMRPRDLAAYLGCTTNAVYAEGSRMGLCKPKAPPKPKTEPVARVRRRMPDHIREILMGG